jgi:hypothetical protein
VSLKFQNPKRQIPNKSKIFTQFHVNLFTLLLAKEANHATAQSFSNRSSGSDRQLFAASLARKTARAA